MNSKISFLLALFIGLLIGMNLLGSKIVSLFGISVSVGIFMVPFTFLITDMVAEVHGQKTVRQFIYGGLTALILVLIFTSIFVYIEPHERYAYNEDYKHVFGNSLRMIIASIVAFFFAQMHDVIAYEFWKKKTGGKMLWLRNNLSTIVSQLIDTFLYMMIAFYLASPKFTFEFILQLMVPYYLFKVGFAIIDTPLVYLGVPDLKYGEAVMAWIILKDGEQGTEEEFKAFCKGKIAHFKMPAYFKFATEFPMTVTGKIRKVEMRAISIKELNLEKENSIETA